ncbi:hypothetical protein CCUS01_03481 [Colletotrichum cuscutae]|uniref:Heterokaryon incompatibility domain-containing protein n=1 Tax=Colletotrichum cuscutae TaxID=1209917 RepID=A0AAI9Y8K5_9PEZI|nr:hypothetical protein CCUS01_03481 [Colletotrichum cuscutae]
MMGYDDDDGMGSRLFEHRASDTHRMVPKSDLVIYNPSTHLLGMQMYSWATKRPVPERGSMVVYIDGACRNNGLSDAQASWGVYFGPGSRYNACGLLARDLPQTSSRAEIEALVQAMRIICEITGRDYSLNRITIATDSEYLATRVVSSYGLYSPNNDGYRLPHTKESLEQGKGGGCRICSLIWFRRLNFGGKHDIPWPDWDDLDPDDSLELRYGFASGTQGYEIHMGLWRLDEENTNRIQTIFFSVEETTAEIAASIPREESILALNTNTGSEQAFGLAQKFLTDCLTSHDCSMQNEDGWAPTRLIDLGESPSDVAKLVHSQSLQRPVQWMTLSHCWGLKQPCTLLETNIKQFMIGIPHTELSKTFFDAFIIARRLGVRYLWIDSICIIQRSEDDWRREAPTMGKVYSLSLCTISASHAADGSGGCFSDRDPWTVLPCVIPSPFSTDSVAPPFLLHGENLDARWKSNIPEAPLHKRAWVFQERLLSPQTLYFGRQQILWGCGHRELCESFPEGRFRDMLLESAGTKPFEAAWSETVKMYSKTKLTFPSDRQVAFSGLPGQLQDKRDTQQAYGVWIDESLPWALLWSAQEKVRARPTDYLAPSWSWMTLNTQVTFGNWYPHGTGLVMAVGLITSGLGGMNRIGKAENDGLIL